MNRIRTQLRPFHHTGSTLHTIGIRRCVAAFSSGWRPPPPNIVDLMKGLRSIALGHCEPTQQAVVLRTSQRRIVPAQEGGLSSNQLTTTLVDQGSAKDPLARWSVIITRQTRLNRPRSCLPKDQQVASLRERWCLDGGSSDALVEGRRPPTCRSHSVDQIREGRTGRVELITQRCSSV